MYRFKKKSYLCIVASVEEALKFAGVGRQSELGRVVEQLVERLVPRKTRYHDLDLIGPNFNVTNKTGMKILL